MESYSEQLEREVREIKLANPKIEQIVKEVKDGLSISNADIDYAIERDWRIFTRVQKILNEVKRAPANNKDSVCRHLNVQYTTGHCKCIDCGENIIIVGQTAVKT